MLMGYDVEVLERIDVVKNFDKDLILVEPSWLNIFLIILKWRICNKDCKLGRRLDYLWLIDFYKFRIHELCIHERETTKNRIEGFEKSNRIEEGRIE